MTKGLTYNGISVNQRENVKFRVHIKSEQLHSYKACNLVERVDLVDDLVDTDLDLKTTCAHCPRQVVTIVNSQLEELIKSTTNQHMLDSLGWHLTDLISNQHFSGPIPLVG